jgi:hypothetical protein
VQPEALIILQQPQLNLGNQLTAPANQELGEQEKGRLLPLTSPIEGVVQPEALIILQQPQLSPFLITIPNLTPSIPNLTPQQQNNVWRQN